MYLPHATAHLLQTKERQQALMLEAQRYRLQTQQMNIKNQNRGVYLHRRLAVTIGLLIAMSCWLVASVGNGEAWAQADSDQPTAASEAQLIFLPMVGKYSAQSGNTPTPTATTEAPGTETPTPTPTATPTASPTATTEPTVDTLARFLNSEWRTSSAAMQTDATGGIHVGYYYYEAQFDDAPNYAMYAYCASDCEQLANWQQVALAQDRDVIEVQLALTAAGQPRMLIRAVSTVYPAGKDYLYAACDQNCTSSTNWQIGYVLSSDGTDILDVNDDNSPQRSFALDPQDRPRFLYQDRNYANAEPDHYGHYYVSCNSNCIGGTPETPTWQQTRITEEYRSDFQYEYEIINYPSLTFTQAGAPRVLGVLYPTSHSATPEGIYYFGCDNGCDDRANWQRVWLLDRGSGTEVSWDLTLDSQDRPRLALYRGTGTFEAEKVLYIWCNETCLDQATKDDHWQFNDPGVAATDGRHPALALDSQERPHIAYTDQTVGGLGYVWCSANCESDSPTWHHQAIEGATDLHADWPVAIPPACDTGLWHGLTPVLSLSSTDQPTVAYDTTYHARCFYDDPSDGQPPFTAFHLIVRAVRVIRFALP